MRIYKYQIEEIKDVVIIEMPESAQVLHVGQQNGVLTIWASVDPEARMVRRKFRIVGPGHDHDVGYGYYGTVFIDTFVWHVFAGGIDDG